MRPCCWSSYQLFFYFAHCAGAKQRLFLAQSKAQTFCLLQSEIAIRSLKPGGAAAADQAEGQHQRRTWTRRSRASPSSQPWGTVSCSFIRLLLLDHQPGPAGGFFLLSLNCSSRDWCPSIHKETFTIMKCQKLSQTDLIYEHLPLLWVWELQGLNKHGKQSRKNKELKTNSFIGSYDIRNRKCITVQLILVVPNMLIHAVKIKEMWGITHQRLANIGSQRSSDWHKGPRRSLWVCSPLPATKVQNQNIQGCTEDQTEALVTGTTRLFRPCKRSKWIRDLREKHSAKRGRMNRKGQRRWRCGEGKQENLRENQIWPTRR